ncbi:MAG: VCBS repeat-containing protein [Planctomycetes bacterium]|nr:VCBS repeat-containing protein [Planctomycetota bacterium]
MRTPQHISKACKSRRNALIAVAIGLSILALQPPPAGAQEKVPTFKNPVVFDVGDRPFGLAVADVTGGPGGAPDGYPDLAVANENAGTVTFYVNTRDWKPVPDGFGTPTTLQVGSGTKPLEVAFAKINNDIYLDLVVTASGDNALYVFLFNPDDPPYSAGTRFPLNTPGVGPRGLVIADFDNDGFNDAAVASELLDLVVVVFNDGLGGLSGHQEPILLNLLEGATPYDLVVGDFERSDVDSPLLDLATANFGDDSISVLRNNGNRDFTPLRRDRPFDCTTPWWGFEGIAVGRFDLGLTDDVACTAEGDDFANVFLGDGQSDFDHDCDPTRRDRYQLHCDSPDAWCWGIDAGHLNGGTKPDLAVALEQRDVVSVLLGLGDGTFQRPSAGCADPQDRKGYLYSVVPPGGGADNPIQVKIVDLNQDGFGDLVTSNQDSDNISVLISTMIVAGGPGGGL